MDKNNDPNNNRVCPVSGQVFDFVDVDPDDYGHRQNAQATTFAGWSFDRDNDRNGELAEPDTDNTVKEDIEQWL